MLEIRNLPLPLSGGRASGLAYDEGRLRDAVAAALGVSSVDVADCRVARRSVDARNKSDVHFVATVRARLSGGDRAEACLAAGLKNVVVYDGVPYEPPVLSGALPDDPPVVVGAGAAGLFCALALAEAGIAPVLVERGRPAGIRSGDVARFNETGVLDEGSNIQFGAGGAGTFSDGKLTTGTNSPANAWVLRRFVEAGASPDILWQGKPHIGSDVLPTVVSNIVARIEACGGRVLWESTLVDVETADGALVGAELACRGGADGSISTLRLDCRLMVLACGHSARDVFFLLKDHGVTLEPKVFSVGARIEHLQETIDRAQYGKAAGHPCLPAADYKLSWHTPSGRGVYTFCMCPGGTVVAAASERGGVVTNGMSEFARDGANANAAVLVNVAPEDLPGIDRDVLAGVGFQRALESAAYGAGGGSYVAPAQLVGDFLQGVPSSGPASVAPTYPRGVAWGDVGALLPPYVADALREGLGRMARRMRRFDDPSAVLTGLETRSSSPVRVVRGNRLCSVDVDGLYPCGEGAGYAGGIMSAAVDGLRCAAAIVDRLNGNA